MRHALILAAVAGILTSVLAADDARVWTYRGKVVDDTGRGLAGATVNAFASVAEMGRSVTKDIGRAATDADGNFAIALNDGNALSVFLTARKEGWSCGWSNWRQNDLTDVVITLTKPSDLAGVVVGEGGKPIAGAVVHPVLRYGRDGISQHIFVDEPVDWLIARTGDNGRFRLSNLPDSAQARFEVTAAGWARLSYSSTLPESKFPYAAGRKDIKLVMRPEGRIEGVLAQKDGKPISDVGIMAGLNRHDQIESPVGEPVVTDKDGRFSIGGLDDGDYTLRVAGNEGLPGFVAIEEGIKVRSGKTTSGIKVVARRAGLLEVTVKDDKGRPFAGAWISVMPLDRSMTPSNVTGGKSDDRGKAQVRLEAKTYMLIAIAPGFCYYHSGLDPDKPGSEIAIEEGKTTQVNIALKPLTWIKGIVVDADGKPVGGAAVAVQDMSTFGMKVTTDAKGQFEVGADRSLIANAPWRIRLEVRHVERGLAATASIADTAKPVEITAKPGASLTGDVVDEEGKPLADAKVGLKQKHISFSDAYVRTALTTDATTDDQGRYQFQAVSAGSYRVSAEAYGCGRDSSVVEVGEVDRRVDVKRLVLGKASFTVSGIVVDAQGHPVPGVDVIVYGQGQPTGFVRSDKEGKFTSGKVVAGKVTVAATMGLSYEGMASVNAGDQDVKVVVRKLTEPATFRATTEPATQGAD